MTYDGLTVVTAETVGAGLGNAATTKTTKDAFGRLVRVDEALDAGSSFATTTYSYDPNDNVQQIVDPEGVTTTMQHDFASHRTSITRPGNRTWAYSYNRNGDVISEIDPGGTSPTDINFINTTVYDDLDRPISKLLGHRNLSDEDVARFGADNEAFDYDDGPNEVGRLTQWTTFAPGSSFITAATAYIYDARGQVLSTESGTQGIAGLPALLNDFGHHYYLNGSVRHTAYGGTYGAALTTVFLDAKGLPASLDGPVSLTNTRNVAGLVTKRSSTAGPADSSTVQTAWTYDTLGRVTSQHILEGTASTFALGQDLAYFGNDDPKTMDQYLPSGHKQFTFGYDFRHQLTSAAETTTSGYFSAAYQYGTAGRFQHATEASSLPPGSEVKPRDVGYQYAGNPTAVDPEEVTGLLNADGSSFASYEYDAAGNQIYRCDGTIASHAAHDHSSHTPDICVGSSLHMDYDGKDQLRRVISMKNNAVVGSEEYWYDQNGSRLAKLKLDNHGNPTELIWWIGDEELHYDGTGTETHDLSYITIGEAVARVDRSADSTNVEYEFHGLGNSTLAAVDQATGTVNAGFSYAPFGEVIEATDGGGDEGLSSHRRRWNDKFVDEVSALAYYGIRYYDTLTTTWTQSDPVYRVAPDLAQESSPRRANLYAFSLNNPLRYVDPDGREVLSYGGLAKASQTASALQEIVTPGTHVEVVADPVYPGYQVVLAFDDKEAQAAAQADRATSDLLKATVSNDDLFVIYNVDTGSGPDASHDPHDAAATAALADQGYAETLPPARQKNGVTLREIYINYSATSDPNKNPVEADDGSKTRETAGTAIGHELNGHGVNNLDEPAADSYENHYLRPKANLPSRKQKVYKKTSKPGQGVNAQSGHTHSAPADADHNGTVTDEEESNWMRQQQ